MHYFSSIVFEALHRAKNLPPPTLAQIVDGVTDLIRDEHVPRRRHLWFMNLAPDDRVRHVRLALGDAEELALVTPVADSEGGNEVQRWRIEDSWSAPGSRGRDGDDGGDGGGRERSLGGGDDNQDGGGLVEALSHPVLFSLDEENFAAVVERLFEENRS